ncbi:MAG TPA: peroxidase family protein [Thiolinea sp.]|nr:peroxidase family protein [Thiolinea sp.]
MNGRSVSQGQGVYGKHRYGGGSWNPGGGFGGGGLNASLGVLLQQLVRLLLQHFGNPPVTEPQTEYRSIDGSGNNRRNPELGSTGQALDKSLGSDTAREPGGMTEVRLPSAREVSNAISAQSGDTRNSKGLSDLFWIWGQFLDHDLTLVHASGQEQANVAVPEGDPWFDPAGTGTASLAFTRSDATIGADGQRQQHNSITAFLDGSNVYGSDVETAASLRDFAGGRLKESNGNMLPVDATGAYLAGDERANENPGLTSMHTLWVREHNRIADELAAQHPDWGDETLYQEARRKVVAEMQAITYNEFLPNLLGDNALPQYQGYNPSTDPDISNEFASAAYRFGHTMLSPQLMRLDENGQVIPEGNLSLREAFFNPARVAEAGIDPILRGAASQTAQAADPMVIDDVRNFLISAPGFGGLDLVSLNIQRGRDHGVAGYNDVREQLGLPRITSFEDPVWQGDFGQKLSQVYASPDDVDLWVGGLAEQAAGDALLGPTMSHILENQFVSLRDGDRFWYQNQFSGNELNQLQNLRLSDIIERNTDIQNIQDNVMVASNVHLQNTGTATTNMRSMAAPAAALQSAPPARPLDPAQIRQLQDAAAQGLLG